MEILPASVPHGGFTSMVVLSASVPHGGFISICSPWRFYQHLFPMEILPTSISNGGFTIYSPWWFYHHLHPMVVLPPSISVMVKEPTLWSVTLDSWMVIRLQAVTMRGFDSVQVTMETTEHKWLMSSCQEQPTQKKMPPMSTRRDERSWRAWPSHHQAWLAMTGRSFVLSQRSVRCPGVDRFFRGREWKYWGMRTHWLGNTSGMYVMKQFHLWELAAPRALLS